MNLPSLLNTEDLGLEPRPRSPGPGAMHALYHDVTLSSRSQQRGSGGIQCPKVSLLTFLSSGSPPLSPLIAPWNGGKARFLGRVTEKPLSVETQRVQSSAQHKEGWRVLSTLCMPDPCLYYLI